MNLTWHEGSNRWSKVIGKWPDKRVSKLVQPQFYFGANREQAAVAAAGKADWKAMERSWKAAHQLFLETLGQPFADVPH